jgi:hypothetical protein
VIPLLYTHGPIFQVLRPVNECDPSALVPQGVARAQSVVVHQHP